VPDHVPDHVLDLFVAPAVDRPLGGGRSVVAGDLVLSPGHDPQVDEQLSPLLARLAVTLDERPGRVPGSLRVAVPVPARDGSWVVDGWAATRWEPGTRECDDPGVTLAAGRLLHAELAVAVPRPPQALAGRTDPRARAERLAFGPVADLVAAAEERGPAVAGLVRRLCAWLPDPTGLGPSGLVHAALAGKVLLDPGGSPVVVDVTPAWRPAPWAEAVCALGTRMPMDEQPTPVGREALARAAAYRLLGEERPDAAAYASALEAVGLP